MSEGYSYDDSYGYSDNSDQSESIEKPEKVAQSRIQFNQQSTINMQVGQTGQVQIVPGPNNSFSITFMVNNDPKQSLNLSIIEGVCKVNAENALIQTNSQFQEQNNQQFEQQQEINSRDPSLLYGYKKI